MPTRRSTSSGPALTVVHPSTDCSRVWPMPGGSGTSPRARPPGDSTATAEPDSAWARRHLFQARRCFSRFGGVRLLRVIERLEWGVGFVDAAFEDADEGQVPVQLPVIESVADDELVGDLK